MLELGRAGSAGTERGEVPVLRDGVVVATVRAARLREAATAVVGDVSWTFASHRRVLTGRWTQDPEDVVRLSAQQASWWGSSWEVDLEGMPVEVESASWWKGTRRYLVGGRVVATSGVTGGWSPRATLTAESSIPLAHQVFLLWLEQMVRRRNQLAVTAGSGAAVYGGGS